MFYESSRDLLFFLSPDISNLMYIGEQPLKITDYSFITNVHKTYVTFIGHKTNIEGMLNE